jgi:hypothetical protein
MMCKIPKDDQISEIILSKSSTAIVSDVVNAIPVNLLIAIEDFTACSVPGNVAIMTRSFSDKGH